MYNVLTYINRYAILYVHIVDCLSKYRFYQSMYQIIDMSLYHQSVNSIHLSLSACVSENVLQARHMALCFNDPLIISTFIRLLTNTWKLNYVYVGYFVHYIE